MAFAPSPRHTLVNPSPNASPGSPFSPRDNLSPLASGSCSAVRPGSMNRRKSSGQTIQTLGRSKQHYIGSPGSVAGAGGRRKSSHHQLSAKPNGVVGNDGQWATMDPDEVFRRLNVKEVKKVEGILRSSAAGKQGELRSMVSERYRDLLLSTSQISQLRDSSLRLSTTLKHIESLCQSPKSLTLPNSAHSLTEKRSSHKEHDAPSRLRGLDQENKELDVKEQLPVAALVKLLLDVPEALYSYLSAKQFLEAALLWLLARVVKEELVNSSSDASETSGPQTFLPLVQKQWEILVPLRGQIVERATASLQDIEPSSEEPKAAQTALAYALLAILLLEAHKNPLPEVLNLFLSQRLKALQDIHATAVQTGSRPSAVNFSFGKPLDRSGRSPISARNSLVNEPERKNRHSRKDSRLNAAEVLRGLSPASRNVGRARSGSASDVAESNASRKAKNQEKRKINEQNRASKVFQDSIKLLWETVASARAVILSEDEESLVVRMMKTVQTPNLPQTGSDANITLVSTSMLLRNMPSSQILQSYLPASIQNFAPYIGDLARGVQEGTLRNTLEDWLEKSLHHLELNSVAWLEGLDTVTDVWVVKRRMSDMLDEMAAAQDAAFKQDEFTKLRKEISKAFTDRAKAIWQLRLDALAIAAENGVNADLEALMQGDDDVAQDIHPSLAFFNPIAFPSHRSGPASSSNELRDFASTLRKRLHSRTPLLDDRLGELERMAFDIKNDLRCLKLQPEDSKLIQEYRAMAIDIGKRITQTLWNALEMVPTTASAKGDRATTRLFVGRLALALSTQSRTLPVLLLGRKPAQDLAIKLDAVYMASLSDWRDRTVQDAMEVFTESAANSLPDTVAIDLSNGIMFALQEIATAIFDCGIDPEYRASLTEDISKAFGKQALEMAVAKALPLTTEQQEVLEAIVNGSCASLSEAALNTLRKSQLLLHPAIAHLATKDGRPSDIRYAGLLPLGVPTTSHDYSSPVPLVKPSTRFSMLSIV